MATLAEIRIFDSMSQVSNLKKSDAVAKIPKFDVSQCTGQRVRI